MDKKARRVSAMSKIGENASTAIRSTAPKRKSVRTGVDQPNASASKPNSSTEQGQRDTVTTRRPVIKKYLDRITIAGLHNYLYATERDDRVTWNLTFLIAIVGTLFYLVTTIRTYLQFTIVLDIHHQTEPAAQLPNVWVCTEAINVSYISQQFEKARPMLLVDSRMRQHAKRYMQWYKPMTPFYSQWNSTTLTYETVPSVWNPNTTSWEFRIEDIVDRFILWSQQFSITSPIGDDFGTYTYVANVLVELLYIAVNYLGADWLGYKSFYEEGMFSCESVMKNCTLNGVAFDCCASGSMGSNQGSQRCFRLDVNRTASARHLQQSSSSSITLTFETIIDSSYFRKGPDEIYEASGISVSFGPRMPGMFEVTQMLAPATVSTIAVQPMKKVGRTGCVKSYRFDPGMHANSHPLITNYFKAMVDPKQYTVGTCEVGKLLDAIYIQCGCVLYYDTIRSQNDSDICTPAHMYACLYRTFHDVSPNGNAGAGVEDQMKRATMRHLKAASATECQPLCESWTYDFRASSMIAAGSEGNVSRYFRNKVTITIEPEYRLETEVYKMDYLTLAASLGVAFGCILGISAITLIQLPIWTVVAVVMQSKQSKISPLQK